MINTFSHITEQAHQENSNIFHWLISNPPVAIGLIALIVLVFAILLKSTKVEKNNKNK